MQVSKLTLDYLSSHEFFEQVYSTNHAPHGEGFKANEKVVSCILKSCQYFPNRHILPDRSVL